MQVTLLLTIVLLKYLGHSVRPSVSMYVQTYLLYLHPYKPFLLCGILNLTVLLRPAVFILNLEMIHRVLKMIIMKYLIIRKIRTD